MSRTFKDKKNKHRAYASIHVGKKVKEEAKQARKSLQSETNPRALKIGSADRWNYD